MKLSKTSEVTTENKNNTKKFYIFHMTSQIIIFDMEIFSTMQIFFRNVIIVSLFLFWKF